MGQFLNDIYKESFNAFNISLRKSTIIHNTILHNSIDAGAVSSIVVQYEKDLPCPPLSSSGWLVLLNGSFESETIGYSNFSYDSVTGIINFTVDATLQFNYSSCVTSVNIDCGRIDCENIDIHLVVKDDLNGNVIIDKFATKVNSDAGMFELVLDHNDTNISPAEYYYTLSQVSGSENVVFENSTFFLLERC